MDALYNERGQNSSYTRTIPDPGGENEIILFKSCFPNSALEGSPDEPPGSYEEMSVSGAKYVYNTILQYFATRPDKLFVVLTAPPLSDSEYADNARAFNNWLLNDWLSENNYTDNNVAVFDFYNVLTDPNAHHRFVNGQVEHILGSRNPLYYPSEDDHPSVEGSRKGVEEIVPLLNFFYHRWQSGGRSRHPYRSRMSRQWVKRLSHRWSRLPGSLVGSTISRARLPPGQRFGRATSRTTPIRVSPVPRNQATRTLAQHP